jgi:hypothetical protein
MRKAQVEKYCTRCRQRKPIAEFSRRLGGLYFQAKCKPCAAEIQREYAGRHPERFKRMMRKAHLKKMYGLSPDRYLLLYEAQDGECAICRRPEPKQKLCVDHNHETKSIRGLLCSRCNTGVGLFLENPRLLLLAAGYLLSARERRAA